MRYFSTNFIKEERQKGVATATLSTRTRYTPRAKETTHPIETERPLKEIRQMTICNRHANAASTKGRDFDQATKPRASPTGDAPIGLW